MTERTRLPNRRLGLTGVMTWHGEREWLVTVGFDRDGQAREIFVGNTKPGGFIAVWVHDSCIILSKLLQHGASVQALLAGLAPSKDFGAAERSFLAHLIEFAAEMERENATAIAEAYACAEGRHPFQLQAAE